MEPIEIMGDHQRIEVDNVIERPSGWDGTELALCCGYNLHWPVLGVRVRPYLFFTRFPALPNRGLTRNTFSPVCLSTGDTDMSDFTFIALCGGTLLVLALYARALDRL
ncbi:hypothetical protein [Rhizobium halophilum]|uniref:hypothetical protein n=1 Tax=Rhizobium halophilum TaxID=2846852 RepID=UPI001EFC75F2|nr:hypothetical protein [Rhizobium halophilum]MCF6371221.1 hypothetical protein [Rhizobium halophilum]